MTRTKDQGRPQAARAWRLHSPLGRTPTTGTWCSITWCPLENASQRERFEAVARSLRDLLTAALAADPGDPRQGESQAGLLPVDGVPDRPHAGQQHHQPGSREVRPRRPPVRPAAGLEGSRSRRSRTPAWATAAWAGWRPASSSRWPRCRSRRWATACATNTASSGRRSRTASRSSTRTTGWRSPIPGKWSGRGKRCRCRSAARFDLENGVLRAVPGHATHLLGVPYDRPVVGYGGRTINTLRLWGAASPDFFDFGEFSSGDFVGAIVDRVVAETVTRVLYPDDSTRRRPGAAVLSRSISWCAARWPTSWPASAARTTTGRALPDKVAIQLNDTHPAMAVAELMRILLDQAQARLGRGVGPDRPHAGLHQSHLAARGPGKMAGPLLRAGLPAAAGDHLRDQPPLPRRRPAALSGRRGPRAAR